MPRLFRPRPWLLVFSLAAATPGRSQVSPFLPTDDPRLPLVEHLIARGEIRDPAALDRPFRRGDLLARLDRSSSPIARRLLTDLTAPRRASWSTLAVRVGPQLYSQGRRDLLQTGGDGDVGAFAEVDAAYVLGSMVFGGRFGLDTRLGNDPDYPERGLLAHHHREARIVDLYVQLQRPWGSIHLGQMARNWGPAGIPGVPLSDASYPRPDLGLTLGRGALRFSSVATRLRGSTTFPPTDSAGGGIKTERYLVAHRLAIDLGSSLTLAAWEVGVIAGTGNELDGTTRAVVPLLVIPALLASRSHRNEMVGGDISWRPSPRLRLEAQLAIDDWNFDANNPYPQRWAGSLSAAGALGRSASWKATYATASSLAFRTLDPEENIVDQGIGIGRLFPDNEIVDLSVGVPLGETWLLSPRMALLRQGEGRIQDSFPAFAEASSVPARFIGTIATTWWTGVALSGWHRRLHLSGEAGVRHTRNAGHLPGRTATTLEGRVMVAAGFTLLKTPP
jgi:hypothetical protein